MRRLATFVAISCVTVLAVAPARAKTLDDLKAELAAKKADVAKLERRIRQMEGQVPAKAGVPPLFVAPVAGPTAQPPTTAVNAATPSDDRFGCLEAAGPSGLSSVDFRRKKAEDCGTSRAAPNQTTKAG